MNTGADSPILMPTAPGIPVKRAVQTTVALAAVLAAAGGAVAVLAPSLGSASVASVGQAGSLSALLVVLAGTALVASGATAWIARPDRGLAVIALCAAATWMAAELAGSASAAREARSLGLLIAPFFVPLVIHLPVRVLRADASRGLSTWALVALYVVVAIAALGWSLTYDPFFDIHCAVCARGDNLLAVSPNMRAANAFAALGAIAAIFGGIVSALWAMWRLARGRRGRRRQVVMVLGPTLLVGTALAWSSAVRLVVVPDDLADPQLLVPAAALAVGSTLLGAGATLVQLVQMRRKASLQHLVEALSAAACSSSLRATLARTLGDERLRVAYPVEGGGLIDETGEEVEAPRSVGDRAVAAIRRGPQTVALVEHDAGLDPDLLDREIGAAARLAVDNERLEATIRARLRELQASRARIVEAGDLARGRLERDLHDGAQQRLLAVSFELRLAHAALVEPDARAQVGASIEAAIAELDRALDELRELAHGIHPVVLRENGLLVALESLADSAALSVAVHADGIDRCGAPAELAAYMAVAEAIRQAETEGADRVDVTMFGTESGFSLAIDGVAAGPGGWQRIEDRVGAAGGTLELAPKTHARMTMTVELPCA